MRKTAMAPRSVGTKKKKKWCVNKSKRKIVSRRSFILASCTRDMRGGWESWPSRRVGGRTLSTPGFATAALSTSPCRHGCSRRGSYRMEKLDLGHFGRTPRSRVGLAALAPTPTAATTPHAHPRRRMRTRPSATPRGRPGHRSGGQGPSPWSRAELLQRREPPIWSGAPPGSGRHAVRRAHVA
ncbi:unnamed protein product [Urochloa humidicola]